MPMRGELSALWTVVRIENNKALHCIYTAILPAPILLNRKGTTDGGQDGSLLHLSGDTTTKATN